MIRWWRQPSGWGPYGRTPNGVLVKAVIWTVVAAPFALTYGVYLEAKYRLSRRR